MYNVVKVRSLTFRYLLVAARQDVAVSTRLISHHLTTNIARHDTAAISPPLSQVPGRYDDVRSSLAHESTGKQQTPACHPPASRGLSGPTTGYERLPYRPRQRQTSGISRARSGGADPDLAARRQRRDLTCASRRARRALVERRQCRRSRHVSNRGSEGYHLSGCTSSSLRACVHEARNWSEISEKN